MKVRSIEQQHSASAGRVSLYTVFIVPYAALILGTIAAVGYFSFLNGQAAVNNVAQQLRSEVSLHIRDHLLSFLDIPHKITQMNSAAIQKGLLDPSNADKMQEFFLEQVQTQPSISSIYFGNAAGGIIGGGREGAGGSLYVYSTDNLQPGIFRKYDVDSTGKPQKLVTTVPNFDARTRPWFISAVQKGDATWSAVYILITGQDMAIAASRPVYSEDRELLGVVSVDIFLSQLDTFLQNVEIGPIGESFGVESSGMLVAASSGEKLFTNRSGDAQLSRVFARDSQSALIRESAQFLTSAFGSFENIPAQPQQLEFWANGERQFLELMPVHDPSGINWTIIVAVPESAFMTQINNNNRLTLVTILLALLASLTISFLVTTRVTRHISQLHRSTRALARGDWKQDLSTNSRIYELDGLAASFNQMKAQLHKTLDNLRVEIEERKEAERALHESEAYQRAIISNAPFGGHFYRLDSDDNLRFEGANPAADQILKHDHTKLIGKTIEEAFPGLVNSEIPKIYLRIAKQGNIYHQDQLTYYDGEIDGIFEIHAFGTAPRRMAVFFTNITERKRAEEALRQSEERFSLTFHNSPVPLVISTSDPQSPRYVEANAAYLQLVGYTWDELSTSSITEVGIVLPDEQRKTRMDILTEKGSYTLREAQLHTKSGAMRDVLISAQRLLIGGKECDIELILDVTERKHAEQQAFLLKMERERARILVQFMQNASHEFRTPLTVIQTVTYLLGKTTTTDEQRTRLDSISQQVESLSKLVEDLTEMSRLDSTDELSRSNSNINTLLRLAHTSEFSSASNNNNIIQLHLDQSLPMIDANSEDILLAFSKLISNAIRYSPEHGVIHLSTRLENSEVVVEIKDQGIGIKPDQLPRIFERFYRIDEAHSTRGFGLGLPIAQRIIDLHGGRIEVESQWGHGSTFTVRLPVKK